MREFFVVTRVIEFHNGTTAIQAITSFEKKEDCERRSREFDMAVGDLFNALLVKPAGDKVIPTGVALKDFLSDIGIKSIGHTMQTFKVHSDIVLAKKIH